MKRLCVIFISVVVATSYFFVACFNAYADETLTAREYNESQLYLLTQLANGDITYNEYASRSVALTNTFVGENVQAGVNSISNKFVDIGNKLSQINENGGEDAVIACVKAAVDVLADYATEEEYQVTDMKGYGALVVVTLYVYNGKSVRYIYVDYVTIEENENPSNASYPEWNWTIPPGDCHEEEIFYGKESSSDSTSKYYNTFSNRKSDLQFFGDVRYSDGSPADDVATSPTGVITKYDFTPADDSDLVDLINEIDEELDYIDPDLLDDDTTTDDEEEPDLTDTDSILKSIFNRLGKLDSDDDAGGLSKIRSTLILIRKNIQKLPEEFKKMYRDLLGLDKEYSEITRLEDVKLAFEEKTAFIGEIRNVCDMALNAYKNSSNELVIEFSFDGKNYTIDCNYFKDYMPAISAMLAIYIYLSYAWRTYRKIPEYISGGGEDK